jgi:hypothetical protein
MKGYLSTFLAALALTAAFALVREWKHSEKKSTEYLVPHKQSVISTTTLNEMLEAAAKDSLCPQVTPNLLRAVVEVESGWNPRAHRFELGYFEPSGTIDDLPERIKEASSHGLTQIMESNLEHYGVTREEIYNDVGLSLRLGAVILGKAVCEFEHGNVTYGLMAYNAGPTWRRKPERVRQQAQAHAKKVLAVAGMRTISVGKTLTLTAIPKRFQRALRRGV